MKRRGFIATGITAIGTAIVSRFIPVKKEGLPLADYYTVQNTELIVHETFCPFIFPMSEAYQYLRVGDIVTLRHKNQRNGMMCYVVNRENGEVHYKTIRHNRIKKIYPDVEVTRIGSVYQEGQS